ncbi:hypothetical protein IW261DRAFT_1626866, partial [Armillaria novae-zelandiae]
NRGAHLRSSILPHSNSTSCAEQHHFHHDQYSSMSIQKSKNTSSEILHATAQRVQQHRPENYIDCVNSENNILSNGNRLFNNESDTHIQAREDFMNNCDGHAYPHSVFPDPDRGVYDVEQLSLPLGSPALIYSTRGSGATLSPTAPFGGLLSQQQGLSGEGAHEYLPSTSVAGKVKSLVLTLLFAIIRGRMKTQCSVSHERRKMLHSHRIVIPYRFDFPPGEVNKYLEMCILRGCCAEQEGEVVVDQRYDPQGLYSESTAGYFCGNK